MFKNVASQKVRFYAFIPSTGLPKTGDAANLTAYVSKDWAALAALTDTSATEVDATNAKGVYTFDLSQAETNADVLDFTCKSSTADVAIVPIVNLQTVPNRFGTMVIDAAGLVDANTVKLGPTGSGTAQTAKDVGAAVPAAAAGASGGLLISGSNSGTTTLGALTVTGAITATGSNDVRLGATERGLIRDKVGERTVARATASGTPTTTSIPTSAMSPATSVADQLKGRIIIFDHDTTTAALRGQATDITASSVSATPTLTVTLLTTAPVSGDTFSIV